MRIGKSRLKTKQNSQRKKEEERVSGEGICREESEKRRRSLRAFIDARRGGEGGFGSGPAQGRADLFCGLVANFYSLKDKETSCWKGGIR